MSPAERVIELVEALDEGHALRLLIRDASLCAQAVPPETLRGYLGDGRFIGTFCDMRRPGHGYFAKYLEWTHFPPGSPQEPLLVVMFVRWQDMAWGIHSVPRRWTDAAGYPWRGEPMLRDAIAAARLRAVAPGWTPAMAGPGVGLAEGTRPVGDAGYFAMGFVEPDFPWDNLIYLENQAGHLCYTDPRAAADQESEDIRLLAARHGHPEHGPGPTP